MHGGEGQGRKQTTWERRNNIRKYIRNEEKHMEDIENKLYTHITHEEPAPPNNHTQVYIHTFKHRQPYCGTFVSAISLNIL